MDMYVPEQQLIKSIRNSQESSGLLENLSEVPIDELLAPGVLRDLPLVGTAVALYRAGNNLAAYTLAKKILLFLKEVGATSVEQRLEFMSRLDAGEQESIGETLVLLLDKADSYVVAKLHGRVMSALISGQINSRLFELYCHTVKRLNPYLVGQLHKFYGNESIQEIDPTISNELVSMGLAEITVTSKTFPNSSTMQTYPSRTQFGDHFYKIILSAET